ncbi:MAG TPA: long-chain fatty acid--CoA ligase [Bryobacteraceae bacterium]|nr:long-chain fatty acid--CoA ligase [Bryobacteraceae bacterium]
MPGRTVFTVLEETAKQYGEAIALYQPTGSKAGSSYRTHSWNEWLRSSREIALGLQSLGLKKGDIAAVLSETRAEFYLVDVGIMGAGAVSAALYTAYPMADLAQNIRDAAPRVLFVEDVKTREALKSAAQEQGVAWPEHEILMTGELPGILTLENLRVRGQEILQRDPEAFAKLLATISPEDGAILYLTSGATGQPKMGLTSHAAVLANIDMGPVALPIGPKDSTVVFLPSAHIAQRIVLELVPMRMGTPIYFSESLAKLPNELRSVRPTIFLAPPRVWERMYATIQTEIKKRPAIARKLFHGALGLGLKAVQYRTEGKPLPPWMVRSLKVADKLVFSKIRERLGGNIRIAASGAAPLGKDLAEFYAAIGMPLIEGYGLTEAGILCFNPIDNPKAGSIGKLLPEVEGRLAEDGELQVRTPCLFEGYYHDEAATRSVVSEDGWFSTGDIGAVDADGFWYITGRKKELIVSSNGKKIYPARIESLFRVEPLVNQILILGDKKPYVTALLTLNAAQAKDLQDDGSTTKAVQAAVSRVNKQLADFERIRRFKVLAQDFSIEQGELTPTMKIRRARVLENHQELVSQLYLGREDSP